MQIVGHSEGGKQFGTHTHKPSNKKSRQSEYVQIRLNNSEDILGVFPHLSLNDEDTLKQSESNAKSQNQVVVKKCECENAGRVCRLSYTCGFL